eukprot:1191035-Pleurochrysis_carterae.AAC.2
MPIILRAAAHGDADADADADVAPPAPPAPLFAGRHAANYELECIRMRRKSTRSAAQLIISRPRLLISTKKTVRALRERDHVQQEAAAQQEGASASAEEARGAYETNLKQQQASANVKYKAMLKQMLEERETSNDKVACLEGEHH